jgi:hypothetical protein
VAGRRRIAEHARNGAGRGARYARCPDRGRQPARRPRRAGRTNIDAGSEPEEADVTDRPKHDQTPREEGEPTNETIEGRNLEGGSYGATEREQTRDVRSSETAEERQDGQEG